MIQTGIQLNDHFAGIVNSIYNAVDYSVSAMESMRSVMKISVDTKSLEGAHVEIVHTTSALNVLEASVQKLAEMSILGSGALQPVMEADRLLGTGSQINTSQPGRQTGEQAAGMSAAAAPIKWQTDGLEVFTGTGIDRFRQEVQSTDAMLLQLCSTQDAIAKRAYNTYIFPPEAFQDLNSMAVRIDNIRDRIRQIESNPMNMGASGANAGLEQLRSQLSQALDQQRSLNQAVNNMDVSAANEVYLRLQQSIGNTEKYIRDNVDGQGRFNKEIQKGAEGTGGLIQGIKRVAGELISVQNVKAALDLSDQMVITAARLDLMNDGLQTTQDLQNMIYLSAQRSRGAYQATAETVSRLGRTAGDAFGSSEEIVAFAEQMNKQFILAGSETSEIETGMLQMEQVMESGALGGEAYNNILAQAPNIIQTIADYMGVPKEELEDMAAKGQITAQIVKNAMFAAADETNEKFDNMPMTFEQIWTSFQNTALVAFQPVLTKLNEIGNSESFQNLVNGGMEALSAAAGIALGILDLLAGGAQLVADNWSWLSPIILGAAGALGVYYGWLLLTKGAELAVAAAQGVVTLLKMLAVPVYAALTGATMAETAAQWGLNSAMYACPVVWIIILIIALIALFYAAVAAVNHFAGTSYSATGLICGAFMTALAFIGNIFIALWNMLVDGGVLIINLFIRLANFLGNVFTDPVGAICRLFFDLADTVLGGLQTLASAVDTIFGSDLAGSIQGWRDSLSGWVDDTFGTEVEVVQEISAEDFRLDRFEYGDAWDAGYSFGQGIDESISSFDPASLFGTDVPGAEDYKDLSGYGEDLEEIGEGTDVIAGDTGSIKDSLEFTQEDLKYLRDIAEQEAVNRFTAAEITIEQTNHNSISSDMDLDGIMNGLTDLMDEAVDIAAEGVHE